MHALPMGLSSLITSISFGTVRSVFRQDGMHPNRTGCRLLGAHLRHAVGTANPNMTVQIRVKDTAARQTTLSPPSSPDPLLRITQGLQILARTPATTIYQEMQGTPSSYIICPGRAGHKRMCRMFKEQQQSSKQRLHAMMRSGSLL